MVDIKYTKYIAGEAHADFDPDWLEETRLEALSPKVTQWILANEPSGIRDQDQDGYREVKQSVLEKAISSLQLTQTTFPLASYFADKKSADASYKRLLGLPPSLKVATRKNDFAKAKVYFTKLAAHSDNSLEKIAEMLARHLNAQAMHAGANLDGIVPLETTSGFSVYGDGRLRFNCVLFAELAYSDLKGIPNLEFQFVTLFKRDQRVSSAESVPNKSAQEKYYKFDAPDGLGDSSATSANHQILLVQDGHNHYLIVDNDSVRYFETTNSRETLKRLYQEQFSALSMGDSPFSSDKGERIAF